MTTIGYHLSSEEHSGLALARHAGLAEEAGFRLLSVSDHFHPWLDRQGHSPFVWSVVGAIARTTAAAEVGTAVTCPIVRMHPAIVAHAAATAATMLPGRFFLGVGTGERLNEHVLGDHWPAASVRQEMLEEAIGLMRRLWRGELTTHAGRYFRVENARLYDVPDGGVPLHVAASGPESTELAGRLGDGLISVAPKPELIEGFEAAGGAGKPRTGLLHVCWASSRHEALRTLRDWFGNTGVPGSLNAELALPQDFEAATSQVPDDQLESQAALGDDPEEHIRFIRTYADAGFERVLVHQVGPDQEGFLRFYADKVLPLVD